MASFVSNINALAEKLDVIIESNEIFDENTMPILEEIANLDLQEAVADLKKGNYLGNRKIDINLSLNMVGIDEDTAPDVAEAIWTDPTKTVQYSSARVRFVDGVIVDVPFVFDGNPITISTHGDLLIQLNANAEFLAKLEDTLIAGFATPVVGEIVRVYDVIGSNSNIERITLYAESGAYKEESPIYYWAKTTSAFQTLSMRAGDIIKIGNEIDNIILLANSIEQVLELQARIPEFIDRYVDNVAQGDVTIYNKLTELQAIYDNLTAILRVYASIGNVDAVVANEANINAVVTNIIPNLAEILDTNNQAAIAVANADLAIEAKEDAETAKIAAQAAATTATAKANEIKSVTVGSTITGAAGTSAAVTYNATNGQFTFIVPQGVKGDKGDSFEVNAFGVLASRSLYDRQQLGFSFLAVDTGELYFKLSNTSGDWSVAVPFGKGDTGDTGAAGNGIADITFTSTTDVSGLPAQGGATDTYTITYTDATTDTIEVYNGIDGSVDMTREEFIATAGQTVFNTVEAYTLGMVNVYLNGVRLASTDFEETDVNTITLAVGATAGDVVAVEAFGAFKVADNYTKAEVDAKLDAQTHVEADITDLDKYTQAEVDALVAVKADTNNPTITGLKETSVAMPANNIDLSLGNLFTKTISGATTLTVSNVPAAGTSQSFILELTNGGSGAITWFSGAKFAKGVAPTLTASGKDILGCYTLNGGTTWNVLVLGLDVK